MPFTDWAIEVTKNALPIILSFSFFIVVLFTLTDFTGKDKLRDLTIKAIGQGLMWCIVITVIYFAVILFVSIIFTLIGNNLS